mgnify:FL=1
MTAAQASAQDASVRNLERVMREAEAYLDARADAAEAERERLCACGIALRACQCPLRRDAAGVRLGSTLAV